MTSLIVLLDSAAINGVTPFQSQLRAVGKARRIVSSRLGDVRSPGIGSGTAGRGFGPFPPTVVGDPANYYGPLVVRTRNRIVTDRRRRDEYFLRPPQVVTPPAVPFTATPIKVELAASHRLSRRAKKGLPPVLPINPGIAYHGPGVRLAPPLSGAHQVFKRGKSRLNPPSGGGGIAFRGPRIKLVPPLSSKLRRGTEYFLRKPTAVNAPRTFFGPHVSLAYSRRGKAKSDLFGLVYAGAPVQQSTGYLTPPRDKAPPVTSFLRPMGPDPSIYKPIAGYLVKPLDRVPPTTALLRPPVVVTSGVVFYAAPIKVALARNRPGAPKSILRAPIVVGPVLARAIATHLAYSRRGTPRSHLAPPTVVAFFSARPTATHLAYSRRGAPKSHLGGPIVVFPFVARPTFTHLAYSRRGKPTSVLGRPYVVFANTTYAQGPLVQLAPQRRGVPKSQLGRPTVVGAAVYFFGPKVQLTKIRPAAVHSILRKPAVVAPVLAPPIRVDLVRIRPVRTIHQLGAPTVVFSSTPADAVADVTLAYSHRGTPKSHLAPPAVVGPVLARAIKVTLAYSRRGRPVSTLHAPAVVGAGIAYHGPGVRLAKPLAPGDIRFRTHSKLGPPTQVIVIAFYPSPIRVTLADIKPPRVGYRIAPPAIIEPAAVPDAFVKTHLAYSRRGVPKSELFSPRVVYLAVELSGPETWLTYSRRGRPSSTLHAPAVVAPVLARAIEVTLVRIRPAAIHSVLRRPVDLVDRDDLGYVRTHLAYSRRGRPLSHLSPPAVVAPVLARAIATHLAYSKRGVPKSHLEPPTLVAPVLAYPIKVTLARIKPVAIHSILRRPIDLVDSDDLGYLRVHLAYSRRGAPKSHLSAPTVVAPVLARAILVHLAPSSRGRTKSGLGGPIVIYPFVARPVNEEIAVILAKSERPKTISRLFPPAVVNNAPQVYYVATTLAYSLRGRPKSFLGKPTDLVDQADVGILKTHLAYSLRGRPASRLSEPAVVAPVLARAIIVHLAPSSRGIPKSKLGQPTVVNVSRLATPLAVHLAYSRRGRPISVLGRPYVVFPNATYAQGPLVQLAPQRRGTPKSRLAPPVVVNAFVATAIKVTLVRIRPARTISRLAEPVVIRESTNARPLTVHLAYSRRGKPLSGLSKPVVLDVNGDTAGGPLVQLAPQRRGTPKSRLGAPSIVDRFYARPISIHLARIRPPRTLYRLDPPAVVAPVLAAPIRISLAKIRPAKTHPFLRAPVLVFAETAYLRPIDVTLAYSLRGKPKSRLSFTVVYAAPQFYARPILTHLAYSRRGTPLSSLGGPIVVDRSVTPSTRVHLAYSVRGVPKSRLRAPAVVAPVLASPIRVELARIRPVRTIYRLAPPTIVFSSTPADAIAEINLAYSRRGAPKSRLFPPAVVAPVLARAILVHLAPSSRGIPKSILREPTVVFPFFARAIDVTLVRIRPVATRWLLRKPTDLVDRDDVGTTRIHLAYSVRGEPKSRLLPPAVVAPVLAQPTRVDLARITPPRVHSILRKPTVIDVRPQAYYLTTWLAYSLRGEPKSILREPSKYAPQQQARYTIDLTLAYQSRGKPKSFLRPPALVKAATVYLRAIDVTLAYSLRGKPKSTLRRPIVVNQFIARAIRVELAPARFPRPKSRLLPVPAAFQPVGELVTHLAYSRRGVPKSILRKPTDLIDSQDLGSVRIHLAYSRRGTPKSFLSPPAVVAPVLARHEPETLAPQRRGVTMSRLFGVIYDAKVYAPIRVELAPSTRIPRAPHSKLPPPALVARFIASPISVRLAKTPPKSTVSFLRPPTAVKYEYYFGPETTFARIRPAKTHPFLRAPVVVFPPPPPAIEARVDVHLAYSVRGKPRYRITYTPGREVPGVICADGVLDLSEVCGVVLTDTSAILPEGVLDTTAVSGGDVTGPGVIMSEDMPEYRVDEEIE